MSGIDAENWIKAHLDGFFFTFDDLGRVIWRAVPRDYMPTHEKGAHVDIDALREAARARKEPWTPEQEATLLEMRNNGATWAAICKKIKRGKLASKTRYIQLCTKFRIEIKSANLSNIVRLTAWEKAEIVRLREQGMAFAEIEEVLHLKEFAARDYYERVQQIRQRMAKARQIRRAA